MSERSERTIDTAEQSLVPEPTRIEDTASATMTEPSTGEAQS